MQRTVGPYQLGDSLGGTPFGELVVATHAARTEPLAVLLLDDRLAKDHRFRGLLRLEIARAGALRHPAIARFVEVGEHGGAPYVVVERLAESQTLATLLERDAALRPDDAVRLIGRLAEGLDAAHGRRLVHGAIDPSSVLVGPDGVAALVGTSTIGAVDEAGLHAVVAERTDAAFVAPERASSQRAAPSGDGYALGVLARRLLGTGGPTEAVVARQCSADPAARFPTCVAFAMALAGAEVALGAQPGEAPGPRPQQTGQAPNPQLQQTREAPSPQPQHTREAPSPQPQHTREAPNPQPPRCAAQISATPTSPCAGEGEQVVAPPPPSHAGMSGGTGGGAPPVSPLPPHVPDPFGDMASPAAPHQLLAGSGTVLVTPIEPTSAMRALLQPAEVRDPIGDLIVKAADRAPAVDALLERYAPDGKIGRFPLGVAVTGMLALLMILAGQAWPATVVLVAVGVFYGVPKLGTALTASETANVKAFRVSGGAYIRPVRPASNMTVPEMWLPNNVRLTIRQAEYDLLVNFGHVRYVSPSPPPGRTGTIDGFELPGAVVTYLLPGAGLLDVRDAALRVLYRREPYAGEPGDEFWQPDDGPLAASVAEAATTVATPPDAPAASASSPPAAPPVPMPAHAQSSFTSQQRPTSAMARVTSLPLPESARASLKSAAQVAAAVSAVIFGAPLILFVVLPHFFGFPGFFIIAAGIALVGTTAGSTIMRAFRLWGSRQATTMLRVEGPIALTYHRYGKTSRHAAWLASGAKVKLDRETHGMLARHADVRVAAPRLFSLDSSRQTADGYLISQHEIPAAITFYEPSGPLLLAVDNPFGGEIYREPALAKDDLGPRTSRI